MIADRSNASLVQTSVSFSLETGKNLSHFAGWFELLSISVLMLSQSGRKPESLPTFSHSGTLQLCDWIIYLHVTQLKAVDSFDFFTDSLMSQRWKCTSYLICHSGKSEKRWKKKSWLGIFRTWFLFPRLRPNRSTLAAVDVPTWCQIKQYVIIFSKINFSNRLMNWIRADCRQISKYI